MTSWVLIDILIVLVVARIVGSWSLRLGQPRVLGEIVAGVLLGPTLLGATWGAPWSFLPCRGADATFTSCLFPAEAKASLGAIGSIALLLFMFLVGLALPPGAVAGKQRQVGFVSAFVLGTPLLAGFFVVGSGLIDSELFQGHTDGTLAFAIFVGALIAVSAFPVMVRILQEMGLDATATAHVGISAAAVVTIGMFLISATAITISASTTPVVDLALKYALVASYLTVFIGLLPKLLHPFTQRCLAAGQLTPELFAVAFVVLFASGVIADRLGISVIVGGFVAGLALPERERLNSELSPQLQPLVSIVLLPIFLAFSGLNTDFRQLTSSALFGLVVFLIASVVAKLGAGAVGARFAGLTWKEGALLGTLMNCRGLLVLVVALDGVNAGLISPAMQVCTVVAALVTTGMTGPLVRRFGESHPAETDGLAVSRVE